MSLGHAKFAPSSMARIVQCPGSVWAQELHRGPAETEETREGEAAHWVKAEMSVGVIVPVGEIAPNGVAVTQEMIDGGALALKCFEAALGDDWVNLIVTERTLRPGYIHPDNWGTPDDWAYHCGTLWLWDYKFGHSPVEAYLNYQLFNYAALIIEQHNLPRDTPVRTFVIQPRSFHTDGSVREWYFRMVDGVSQGMLESMRIACQLASHHTEATAGTYRAGPECEHCTARHACPTLRAAGLSVIDGSKSMTSLPNPGADELSMELALLERAESIIKARRSGLEEHAVRMIKAGTQLPGYAIGFGQGKTVWSKTDVEIITIGQLNGVSLAKPTEAITPLQAKAAGFDPRLVTSFSRTTHGAERLVKAKSAPMFGDKK